MPIAVDIIDRTLGTKHGEQALKLVEALQEAGEEAWWVGGGVRDMLMDKIPHDIDIATSAEPALVQKLFPKTDGSSADLGTVLVSAGGTTFEVTTFRKDDEASDGRHPESVVFTKDKKEDAARRDFTVNAIYWQPITGELFDPFDGEKDLHERLIRFIGEPEVRIEHDALRLLRAVRFKALIDGQYHPETYKALHKKAKNIELLSGTRKFQELEKILLGPYPHIAFEDLWETDILEYLLPELHACKGVAQPAAMHGEGDVWMHIMRVVAAYTEDHKADIRWGALFHDIGKPVTFSIEADRIHFNQHAQKGAEIAKAALDRLQCPGARRDKICWLIEHHMMMGSFEKMDDKRKAHWYYHPWFVDLLQLFWLDVAGTNPGTYDFYESIVTDYNHFLDSHPLPPKPLLKGEEVMQILGIQPGARVGEVLKELYEKQLAKEITKKSEAEDFVKRQLA